MRKLRPNRLMRKNLGLTVVECLFAMAIMLVGLIGIAAMVPFAGRQAADSYQIVHALSTGENALAISNSNAVVTPTLNAPWQLLEDVYAFNPSSSTGLPSPFGDSTGSSFESFSKLYEGDQAKGRFYSLYKYNYDLLNGSLPATQAGQRTRAAIAQNRAMGTGFCVDPMFLARQLSVPAVGTKLMQRDWGNFRRSRFPYFHESYPTSMDPFGAYASGTRTTPRLIRVSLHDPNTVYGTSFKGWMRLPAAIRLATVSSEDVSKVTPDQDRSFGALRGYAPSDPKLTGAAIVQSLSPEAMQSWMATITPVETTPIVDPETLPLPPLPAATYDYDPGTPSIPLPPSMPFYPEAYDLSVVVFAKRNTTELVISDYSAFAADGVVPEGERLCEVLALGPEHRSSSTFDVELNAASNVSAKIKVGDWAMMSRYVFSDPINQVTPIREHHKWYRIIGVSGDDVFPRTVRVAGQPWDWTLPEISIFQSNGFTSSAALPAIPTATTSVTLVPNVVNVYQRTFRVGN